MSAVSQYNGIEFGFSELYTIQQLGSKVLLERLSLRIHILDKTYEWWLNYASDHMAASIRDTDAALMAEFADQMALETRDTQIWFKQLYHILWHSPTAAWHCASHNL